MARQSSRNPGFRFPSGYVMTHVLLTLGRTTGPLKLEVFLTHGLTVLTYQCTHLSKPPAHTPHHDGRVSQPRPLTCLYRIAPACNQ